MSVNQDLSRVYLLGQQQHKPLQQNNQQHFKILNANPKKKFLVLKSKPKYELAGHKFGGFETPYNAACGGDDSTLD